MLSRAQLPVAAAAAVGATYAQARASDLLEENIDQNARGVARLGYDVDGERKTYSVWRPPLTASDMIRWVTGDDVAAGNPNNLKILTPEGVEVSIHTLEHEIQRFREQRKKEKEG
ncbi:MAG TPA: hypothetical protein DCS05_09670 [Nitrospiraceae bacterium]|nr:hypothetical protein [Nitrospiraceae bacterium]